MSILYAACPTLSIPHLRQARGQAERRQRQSHRVTAASAEPPKAAKREQHAVQQAEGSLRLAAVPLLAAILLGNGGLAMPSSAEGIDWASMMGGPIDMGSSSTREETAAPAPPSAPSTSFSRTAPAVEEDAPKSATELYLERARKLAAERKAAAEQKEAEKQAAEKAKREAAELARAEAEKAKAAAAKKQPVKEEKPVKKEAAAASPAGKKKTHGYMPAFLAQFLLLAGAGGLGTLFFIVPAEKIEEYKKTAEGYLEEAKPYVEKAKPLVAQAVDTAQDLLEKAGPAAAKAVEVATPLAQQAWEAAKPLAAQAVEASKPLLKQAQEKVVALVDEVKENATKVEETREVKEVKTEDPKEKVKA